MVATAGSPDYAHGEAMRFGSLLSSFIFPSALAVLAGCTTSVSSPGEPPADAEVSTNATAIVVVEGSSTNEGVRTEAVARFVRARSGVVDADALRMVGAAVDFPAAGSCASLGSRAPAARAISLLDVGGVTLFAGESVAALQPRQLPDVADLVSGVVYSFGGSAAGGSATRGPALLPGKSAYLLRVDGAPESDVAPFAVSAKSPGEPADVRFGGDDGRGGAVSITAGQATELTWEAGSGEDAIYVDLAGTSSAPTMRCLFVDSGRAQLGAAAFGALDDGTITVHRLHRETFHAHGVDPGEVRFDFARVVAFVRR
jgi:hypothetical protein